MLSIKCFRAKHSAWLWPCIYAIAVTLSCSNFVYAHGPDIATPVYGLNPGPAVWATWTLEPWVLACLAVSMVLYAMGTARLWHKAGVGHGVHLWQAMCFLAGWLALCVALVSPLDGLGGHLFSAHMLQHELLMIIVAPLLVLGRPLGAWAWSLPDGWRDVLIAPTHTPAIKQAWKLITTPLSAWLLHALALWLWHVPALFQSALRNNGVHVLQHASFLVSALLFWWAVFGVHARAQTRGWSMLLIFTTIVHTGALGALLTLAPGIWYPAYIEPAMVLNIDPLQDQQLGGLIMWLPAGLAYLLAGLAMGMQLLSRRAPITAQG